MLFYMISKIVLHLLWFASHMHCQTYPRFPVSIDACLFIFLCIRSFDHSLHVIPASNIIVFVTANGVIWKKVVEHLGPHACVSLI